MNTHTMQAVAIDQFGGLETMKVREVPVPEIGPDEVLVHVASAGVGVWDPFEREGGFAKEFGVQPKFPYVLGSDGAGTVEAVGNNVRKLKKGDRVYGINLMNPKGGFYAEYAAVKADNAAPIPGKIPLEAAGAMAVDAVTALRGLDDELKLKAGEKILILGASGGIGHLAVQLAKRMGAWVLAVASGADGVAFVRTLGADLVLDGHKDDVAAEARKAAPEGLDAALVTAGGKATERALHAIKDGGRVAFPNGVEPAPQGRPSLRMKSYDGTPAPEVFEKINTLVEAGPFQVHIAQTFPLRQAVDAQKTLDTHYLGKLALKPTS